MQHTLLNQTASGRKLLVIYNLVEQNQIIAPSTTYNGIPHQQVAGSKTRVALIWKPISAEELQCLATWKDGNTRYLVGKLSHKMATTDEDRYRCFVYERNAHDHPVTFRVAQSGDATCNGLLSATEGSRTMKLTKGRIRGNYSISLVSYWYGGIFTFVIIISATFQLLKIIIYYF